MVLCQSCQAHYVCDLPGFCRSDIIQCPLWASSHKVGETVFPHSLWVHCKELCLFLAVQSTNGSLNLQECVRVCVWRIKNLNRGQRTLLLRIKNTATEDKEPYYRGYRTLLPRIKNPTTEDKEHYYRGYRTLLPRI